MSNNTNYGLGSLQKNSGKNNSAFGAYTAYNNLAANNNTAVGSNSAFFNTTGLNNTSVGAGSMCNNTTGSLNTAVGSSALEGPTGSAGNQNTAIGAQSLYTNQGSLNTAIGTYSALGVTGGNYNTFLGANSSTLNNANYNYSTAIGYNAKIYESNQIMMGGTGPAGYPDVIIPGNAYLPNFTTATSETQLVPKSYVDLVAGGLKATQACICATTTNIDLSLSTAPSASSTDGFDLSTLTDGSYYILVVNQGGSSNTLTSNIDNGVYILDKTGTFYTWSRPPSDEPMSIGKSAVGAFSFVKYGNTYAKTGLVQINDPAIVGTDQLLYQLVYQLGVDTGQGLNSTTVGTNTYINVDSSLNFINFLDSTSGVTNATGTLALGTKSTSTIIGNLTQMSTTTSGYKIDTLDRINQQLGSDPSWNAVNGYYGLAKDAYPLPNPYSSGVKAVSTWTTRTTNDNEWSNIAWAPELRLFAAVSRSGNTTGVMTSPDGINWTTRTTNTNQWRGICWSPELGIFVATAISGSQNRVMTSTNGTTWNVVTLPSSAYNNEWFSVTWSPQLRIFVAVARTGTDRVMTSSNGTNWNLQTLTGSSATIEYICVTWAAELGLFCAVGVTSPFIATSPDGITWTSRTASAFLGWVNVTWSPELGLFVAASQSTPASNNIMTSPDGINWTSRTTPTTSSLLSTCWAAELGLFVCVGNNTILTSPDGITWTQRTSPANNQWFMITWAPELGICAAVSNTGSSNRAMTSSLAGRPPTSYNVFDSSFNNIDQNGNWTFGKTEVSTSLGTSPTASFGVRDSTTNNSAILFLPNCTQGNYNPGIKSNDKVIVTTGASKDLFITENDSVNVGVRIASSGVTVGYGGTTNGGIPNNKVICDSSGVNISTPNSSILCSGSTVSLSGIETITSNLGVSATATLQLLRSTGSSNTLKFVLNPDTGNYNPLVQAGDMTITAEPNGAGILTLTANSTTTNGVRLTPTTALIGAGGTGTTPTAALSFSGTTITPTGKFATLDVSGNTFLASSSGNVGIGTTTPSYKLEVNGNIKGSYLYLPGQSVAMNSLTDQGTYINWNSDGGSGYTDFVSSRGGSSLGGFRFYYQNPGSRPPIIQNYNNPIFTIDISGNTITPGKAAIGKNTANYSLDVSGVGRFGTYSGSYTTPFDPQLVVSGDTTGNYANDNGQIMITGTSNPQKRLGIQFDTTNNNVKFQAALAGTPTTYPICLNPVGGNVGIGNTNPSTTLDVTGTATISTSINTPLVQNSGGTIEINGSQINLDATTIDFQNTSTTTSTSNFTANIRTTSSGVSTTNFLKCKLNGADIWIPYFTTNPSV